MESVRDRRAIGDLRQYISFSIGEEEYGLELLSVKEVIRLREITWLPKAPSFIKGIINLRGDIIPIIDLRDRFGLDARVATAMTRVIVVEVDGRLMGMVVDSASQVVRIPPEQIDPAPPILGSFSGDFITGVGKLDGRLLVILDPGRSSAWRRKRRLRGSGFIRALPRGTCAVSLSLPAQRSRSGQPRLSPRCRRGRRCAFERGRREAPSSPS